MNEEFVNIAIESALQSRKSLVQSFGTKESEDESQSEVLLSETALKDIITLAFLYQYQMQESQRDVTLQILNRIEQEIVKFQNED